MIAETERLNRVIGQLIEFARPLELKKEKIQFMELVQHALKLIAADAQKNKISVETDMNDVPPVEVDSDKVKQVLLNIFLNSVAAMKEGGKLEITLVPGKIICRYISDTGTGIEKMDLPRIYDPYFTSKAGGNRSGAGSCAENNGGARRRDFGGKLSRTGDKSISVFSHFQMPIKKTREHNENRTINFGRR